MKKPKHIKKDPPPKKKVEPKPVKRIKLTGTYREIPLVRELPPEPEPEPETPQEAVLRKKDIAKPGQSLQYDPNI